jgi:hypothetical protein
MPDNRKYADRREALIKAVAKRRKKLSCWLLNTRAENAKFAVMKGIREH